MLKQFFSLGNNIESQKIGANAHIINQINSLQVERDILTKTISRLYDSDSDLSKIQRDRLLLRYQHQLGVVIARIEKLETVSKHPDLGPLGEGLITLMDQKLSHLDQRLYELTTKIEVREEYKQEIQKEPKLDQKQKESTHKSTHNTQPVFEKPISDFIEKPSQRSNKTFEITTLTSHTKMDPVKQTKYDQMLSQLDSDVITPPKKSVAPTIQQKTEVEHVEIKPEIIKPEISDKPKTTIQLPVETEIDDDDDDDLEKIRSDILKTLSKIEQAEVD